MDIFINGHIDINDYMNMNKQFGFVNVSIGNDDCIHFLFAEDNKRYKAVSIMINWDNGDVITHTEIDFGILNSNLHFIQKLNDGYLLVGSRTVKGFKNALTADEKGNVYARYNFGDAIEQCIVDDKNRIITSYFDEGAFGNDPISGNGLVLWDSDGKVLWKNNKYEICDYYAINIDESDNLWFYYYTEFNLVKTNYFEDTVYNPQVNGSSGFLFNKYNDNILFSKGYGEQDKFVIKSRNVDTYSRGEEVEFKYNTSKIGIFDFAFRKSKAVFQDKDKKNIFYFFDWK